MSKRTRKEYLKKLEEDYRRKSLLRKTMIRLESNRIKRFFKWCWYFVSFPFYWLFYNIRDWRSAICMVIAFLLWSASVWLWYVIAFVVGLNTDTGKWLIGIGSGVWIWWASPVGSPFILLVTLTTIGMKEVWNKIIRFKEKRNEEKDN